jgi:hypothetical protein
MDPGLALAVNSCVNDSISTVAFIIQKIKEVVHFKKKCVNLGEQAQILNGLLRKHRTAVTTFQSLKDFEACLKEIEDFVDICKAYTVLEVTWDVIILRKYPKVKVKIAGVKEMFMFESVASIDHDVRVHEGGANNFDSFRSTQT